MKSMRLRLFFAIALITAVPVFGPAASMEQAAAPAAAKKSIEVEDVIAWKTVSTTAISNNGEWFAYRVAPQEGDAELTVRNIGSGKETKFPLGEVGAPAGVGAGAAVFAGGASLQFSDDSKWIAFTTTPARAEAQRLRRQRRPIQSSVTVVNLASGEKKDYPNVRRFAFSGEAATHIALHRAPAQP
ncbi:MAG TPA: hypothetical protein VJ813_11465, partial [Vicinamibacterales bacterium]|nr:hypothetical protein [Vicinamibacterales bacterium]